MSLHGFGTRAISFGHKPEQCDMNQIVPPISLSTTYKQDQPGEPKVYDYSRAGNPTRDVLEANLASLEKAKFCSVFSSGLASVMSLVNIVKSGSHLICSDDVYGGTNRYFKKVCIEKHGLEVSFTDLTDHKQLEAALKSNTMIIWLESPSNPLLKVVDIVKVVKIANNYNKDIIVVVDNTFMSPYYQQPLCLGAHVVLHSLTKYINGHSDVIMGAVMTNDKTIADHLAFMQKAVGAVPSPFDVYLVLRGVKTLHLRMRAHMKNALAIAKFLEINPRVEKVMYPWLESHPQHTIHKKQSSGMSGIVSFYLKGGLQESRAFLSNLKVFILAESLGGCDSLAELPSVMTHASVPKDERIKLGISDNLIRLSVGCEDQADLLYDIEQALNVAVECSI